MLLPAVSNGLSAPSISSLGRQRPGACYLSLPLSSLENNSRLHVGFTAASPISVTDTTLYLYLFNLMAD
jgi:hypothetical protein